MEANTNADMDIDYATFEAETKKHIALVADLLLSISMKLLNRSLHHDDSKLLEPERTTFATVTPKLHSLTYGSEKYKSSCREMGEALVHHYRHNRHHPEFHEHGICGMNLVDLIEMVCDWYAATKRHDDGNFAQSLAVNCERFEISDDLIAIIANTEDMMQEATNTMKTVSKKTCRVGILTDPMATVDQSQEEEYAEIESIITMALPGKIVPVFERNLYPYKLANKRLDIYIIDYGGLLPGCEDTIRSHFRELLNQIDDKPNTLFVIWTAMTVSWYEDAISAEAPELTDCPNVVYRSGRPWSIEPDCDLEAVLAKWFKGDVA